MQVQIGDSQNSMQHADQFVAVMELCRDAVAERVDDYGVIFCPLSIPVL